MIQLFVKMYGLLIVLMVALFYIQGEVADVLRKQAGQTNLRERFAGTFHMVERDLADRPLTQWEGRVRELAPGFSNPLHLDTIQGLAQRFASLRSYGADQLQAGKIVSYDREGGGFYLARRVAQSDRVLILEFTGPRDIRNQLLTINWVIQLVGYALLLLFWLWPFWRDLLALNRAALAVGEGRFDTALHFSRWSPLRDLGEAFTAMSRRIGILLNSHKELTSAVSHELRNPIMRLHYRNALARDATDIEEKNRNLDLMREDLYELDELADEMLTYARLERRDPEVQLELVPVGPWLEELRREAVDLARAQQRDVQLEFQSSVEALRIEPRYMARAVTNLLSNAIRYAQSKVVLKVEPSAQGVMIEVEDDGTGVREEHREKIFEPFTRLDESRDRKTGGFGIGLAIARRVARWHGGDISVQPSALGGARFSIAW